MLQNLALSVSIFMMTLIALVFIWVVRQSHLTETSDNLAEKVGAWRGRIFWGLSILLTPIIAYSLTKMPYKSQSNEAAIVVQAVGSQWQWTLSRDTLPVGKSVDFQVTATDVTHGFGIYDADLKLQTQTQAMPGYTNVLHYTFTKPGTYKVLCMEYCGLAHHLMMAEIKVVAE